MGSELATIDVARRQRIRRIAAGSVAVIGVVGLWSAISPPARGRLRLLLGVYPFQVAHVAATTTAFASCALLLTARGLRRGQRLAWAAAVALLLVSAVLHLAKGLDAEEGLACLAAAGLLGVAVRAFPVLPTRRTAIRAAGVGIGGAGAVIVLATALTMVFGRHLHPRAGEAAEAVAQRLGGVHADSVPGLAAGATPVLVGTGVGLLAATLWLLFGSRPGHRLSPDQHRAERERARAVVNRYGGGTLDYFALRDDKAWFFDGSSAVAYAVRGGVCLVSPDPLGPAEEREQVWSDFMAFAERNGWTTTVLGASQPWLEVYRRTGLHAVYLGDEAIVDCPGFSLEGRAMKRLRSAIRRVERAGITVSFHDPATLTDPLRSRLLALAQESRQGGQERGFSMTLSRLFDPLDTGLLLAVASDADDEPVGFIQWVPASGVDGWSLDVMRRSLTRQVPNGLTDFLIVETIRRVQTQGGRGLCLNFAVLRTVVAGQAHGLRGRFGGRVLKQVSRHAQVESLYRFNAKYDPQWVPRYLLRGDVESLLAQGVALAAAEGVAEFPHRTRS